jgi:hypothetical protein
MQIINRNLFLVIGFVVVTIALVSLFATAR